MRKNINKIVALAIGISIMSGSIMPVFAADTTQSSVEQNNTTQNTSTVNGQTNNIQTQTNGKNILTLDDAIKSAISIDDTLAFDEKNINYQDKINDVTKQKDDFNNVSDDVEDFDNDTTDIKLKKAKQQMDFDEDIVRKKVTDKYNDIVTSQMGIKKASKDLEVAKKNLEDIKLKVSLGSEISTKLKSQELTNQDKQNDITKNQNQLKDKEYSFKVVTGKDVTQYSLEEDIKFEPLKIEGSIDEYLDNAIDSYVKYREQLVKLNKDYYDKDYESDNKVSSSDVGDAENAVKTAEDNLNSANAKKNNAITGDNTNTDTTDYKKKLEDAKSAYTGKLATRITYLTTKLGNYQEETTLNKNKKSFKDQLKSYYTDLRASEDKINYDKKQIEVNNENLSNLKLKYDLGMITETAYNTEVVKSEQSDLDLRAEVTTYNITKEKIQKPWIAFSSAQ